MTLCAIWCRVSKTEQETANQYEELRQWAQRKGFEVTREYVFEVSASVRGRRLPLHSGQPLSLRCRYPSRGVRVTRHHQGFTGIRPSSLPLTCDPGTDTGALVRRYEEYRVLSM
jgi:hypothetical protein